MHSTQNPISPQLTARYPDSPLENRKESKRRQVDIITQTPRIPRYVKIPRSILKKTGPFVADDSTDNEECYTVINSPRCHQPVQSATQTVGFEDSALPNQTKLDDIYDEQNSSIITEKFNIYQPDRSGAAMSRSLRHQAQLQRGDCYGASLKDSKNPLHQTPKGEGSAHGSLKILSGAHVGADKIVPREHILVQADSPTSSLINDELALEAKKSRSLPPSNALGSSGVLASNLDPVIPENAESELLVGFNSYFTTHSQFKSPISPCLHAGLIKDQRSRNEILGENLYTELTNANNSPRVSRRVGMFPMKGMIYRRTCPERLRGSYTKQL